MFDVADIKVFVSVRCISCPGLQQWGAEQQYAVAVKYCSLCILFCVRLLIMYLVLRALQWRVEQ